MRRPVGLIIATGILLAAQTPASPAHAAPTTGNSTGIGQIGIRLLDAPVEAAGDPRARVYIVDGVAPGTTIIRHVGITTTTDTAVDVAVYSAAASIVGNQFTGADGRTGNDLTSWTSVGPAAVSVTPGTMVTATVQIVVPKDTPTGERYGVIWAQVSSAPVPGEVTQVSRVGVRIYLDISGSIRASNFKITEVTGSRDSGGHPVVGATVHNTGPRAIDVSGTVDLSEGPNGLSTGAVDIAKVITVPPGGRGTVSAQFSTGIPAGPWLATVNLTSGTLHERASATVTFPDRGQVKADLHKGMTGWPWPWLGVAIALGLLAALIAALIWRRRSDARAEVDTSLGG